MVTANWPRIRVGPLSFRSPGDILLPRVAHVWSCYPISFSGTNPAYTGRSIRRILTDMPQANRPLGLFPEGVHGAAGHITDAVPGLSRFLTSLSSLGVPVVPVGVSEHGRFILRFGPTISSDELRNADDAATLVLQRIRSVAEQDSLRDL
jgi:1-acyl-sn-glycerol-3-phosphate acyltransferase